MHRWLVLLSLLLSVVARPVWSQYGYYQVTAQPDSVNIFINDAPAPNAGKLFPGNYTFLVEKEGYHSITKKIRIVTDRVSEIHVRLIPAIVRPRPERKKYVVRLQQQTGCLYLTSDLPGLEVFLDDYAQGRTPLRLDNVPSGSHRVTIDTVSATIALESDELQCLRLEDGRIQDVTKEVYRSGNNPVRLRSIDLFWEEDENRARDCSQFRNRRGSNFFHLRRQGTYLVTRMLFDNSRNTAASLRLRFSIYRRSTFLGWRKFSRRAEHTLSIKPRVDHDWCYYHSDEDWQPGDYYLTIEDADGQTWGVIYFRIYLKLPKKS